jgi:hypothetical protein
MTNDNLKNETPTFGNVLLPAVILSLGFKLKTNEPVPVYVHNKHIVRLQKLFTGETAYRFEVAHDWDLESNVVYAWTRLKTVETENEIKELFLVLWGTSL